MLIPVGINGHLSICCRDAVRMNRALFLLLLFRFLCKDEGREQILKARGILASNNSMCTTIAPQWS